MTYLRHNMSGRWRCDLSDGHSNYFIQNENDKQPTNIHWSIEHRDEKRDPGEVEQVQQPGDRGAQEQRRTGGPGSDQVRAG